MYFLFKAQLAVNWLQVRLVGGTISKRGSSQSSLLSLGVKRIRCGENSSEGQPEFRIYLSMESFSPWALQEVR